MDGAVLRERRPSIGSKHNEQMASCLLLTLFRREFEWINMKITNHSIVRDLNCFPVSNKVKLPLKVFKIDW